MKKLFKLRQTPLSQSEKSIIALFCLMATKTSFAFSLPGITTLGCDLLGWMRGDLAVMIFFIIVVTTLLIGFFAKMDWTKILGVIVLFGLMQGATKLFGGFMATSISCLA